jgi:uncharacterized protein YjiK
MAYIFIGNERDIPTLTYLGYKDNTLDSDEEIKIDYDISYPSSIDFSGIKTYDNDNVAVVIFNDKRPIEVYKYDGKPNNHHSIKDLTDDEALPYILDLIDENLIRKVGK